MLLSDIETSFTILMVGMLSVFFILFLVIATARIVIYVTNYFAVDEKALLKGYTIRATSQLNIPVEHERAIKKAVSMVTKGKAKILNIIKDK